MAKYFPKIIFSTDTGASLRAIDIGANVIVKLTNVDGVYDKDPNKNKTAQKLNLMDFDVMYKLALEGANVLHPDAIKLAKEKNIEIRIVYYKTGEVGTIIK